MDGICKNQDLLCVNDSKTGPKCDEDCSKKIFSECNKCDRKYKCIECKDPRYFGDNCNETCVHCSDAGCNIQGYCKEFKCVNLTYGLGCNKNCTCDTNSNEGDCGKFGGQCLNCRFGYFGKKCDKRCYYGCQTELCCHFKEYKDDIKSKLEIKTNYKYIDIGVFGFWRRFEIDYNYGFPLTFFNKQTKFTSNCELSNFDPIEPNMDPPRYSYDEKFTNYLIDSSLYNNQTILITNKDNFVIPLTVDLTIARNVTCLSSEIKEKKISGVIGLGFFNSISNSFFSPNDTVISENENNTDIELNILSYYIKDDEVEFNFGRLLEDQIKYVERLTSCEVILDTDSDIQGKKMTCILDGIKNAKYSKGFKLENASVTFSLGENSSLILGNYNHNYSSYLEKVYFNEGEYTIENNNNGLKSYLYKKDRIDKLQNFGFVFNKFFYSYTPDKFFEDIPNDNTYKRFMIKIDESSNKTEFVLGRHFLNDTQFTINNEEAKIYFYAKNAEYCGELTEEVENEKFSIQLDAREMSLIGLGAIVLINFIAFTIIYFVKERRKNAPIDYQKMK